MPEECSDCGAYFGTAADLVAHAKKAHGGVGTDPAASLSMNPESEKEGLVCALCGQRFRTRWALARHNDMPHPRLPGVTPGPAIAP